MTEITKIKKIVTTELRAPSSNVIIRFKNNNYRVFGKYEIIKVENKFHVFCSATKIGEFQSVKNAVSWCVAAKNQRFELAATILDLDNRIHSIKNDITVRTAIAVRCKTENFQNDLTIKIENKNIRKLQLEHDLRECINLTKYLQYKGFTNET